MKSYLTRALLLLALLALPVGSAWGATNLGATNLEEDFLFAAQDGNLDKVRQLLKDKPGLIHYKGWHFGHTALHKAAQSGRYEVVKELLERGADVASYSQRFWQPIHYAALDTSGNAIKTIQVLAEGEADLNIPAGEDWEKDTPLQISARKSNKYAAAALAKNGANLLSWSADLQLIALDNEDEEYANFLDYLTDDNPVLKAVSRQGLFLNLNDIKILVEAGYDIRTGDSDGKTPLQVALEKDQTEETQKIVKYLKRELNRDLILAIHDNNKGLVQEILARPPDYEDQLNSPCPHPKVTWERVLPLHYAAEHATPAILEMLIAAGADINRQDDLGRTPLYHAVLGDKFANVNFLLSQNADHSIPDETGTPPLRISGISENVRQLIYAKSIEHIKVEEPQGSSTPPDSPRLHANGGGTPPPSPKNALLPAAALLAITGLLYGAQRRWRIFTRWFDRKRQEEEQEIDLDFEDNPSDEDEFDDPSRQSLTLLPQDDPLARLTAAQDDPSRHRADAHSSG